MGGAQFSRGALFQLLQNRHYLGEIRHKEITHPGLHVGIVDPKLFEAVQRRLGANRVKREARAGDHTIAPLTGLIFDGQGNRLSPTFSYGRAGRCYRYYVASDLQCGGAKARSDDGSPARLPAEALEGAILAQMRRLLGRPDGEWTLMVRALLLLEVRADSLHLLLNPDALFGEDHPELAFQDLESRLAPGERVVRENGDVASIRIAIPGRLQFRGGRTWRIDSARRSPVDPALVDALRGAHLTLAGCGCSPSQAPHTWDPIRAPTAAHVLKRSSLALLSPALQAAILAGRAPRSLTLQRLLAADIPLAWADQEAMFGLDDLASSAQSDTNWRCQARGVLPARNRYSSSVSPPRDGRSKSR